MNWNTLDLEEKLRQRSEVLTSHTLSKILTSLGITEKETSTSVIERIAEAPTQTSVINQFDVNALDAQHIFHLSDIKKLCVDYRLRFLSTHYFKGEIPKEALDKIAHLETVHDTSFRGFKIIAPSKMFTLSNANDPLLFIPIQDDYYYLVHKWGNDLEFYRKAWAWCFKNFENLALVCFLLSLSITFLLPKSTMVLSQNETTGFILEFLFVFKSVVAIVLYYAFAKAKNFNSAIWDSHYFNA